MVAVGMQRAVDGLLSSRAARRGDLTQIRASIRKTMVGNRKARFMDRVRRRETTRTLFRALGAGRAALKGDVGSLLQEATSELNATRKARMALSSELRAQLRQGAGATSARVRLELRREREQRLANASQASELRQQAMNAVDRNVEALRQAARTAVGDASLARLRMAQALSEQLGGDIAAIRRAVAQGRSATVQARNESSADLMLARAQWRGAGRLATLSRRRGPPTRPEAPPPPSAEASPAPRETIARDEDLGNTLANRLFDYLANHPDGARAKDLEEILGSSRSQVMRALRALSEEGRVRRQDDLYLAQ